MKRISISIALAASALLLGRQVEGKPVPKSLEKLPAKIDDKDVWGGNHAMGALLLLRRQIKTSGAAAG